MSTHCFIFGINRSPSVELIMFGKVRLAFVRFSAFVDKEPGEKQIDKEAELQEGRSRGVEIIWFSCVEKFTKLLLLLLM